VTDRINWSDKWRCRDVDTDEIDYTTVVEGYDAERAAAEYVEDVYSEREYYDRKGDIRIGVRPIHKDCPTCGGDGIYDEELEDTCGALGLPCPSCLEIVYIVEVELVASCHAAIERFNHPQPPQRCYACHRRMDDGTDHSMIRTDRKYDDPFRYACTEPPTPSPEVSDVDAQRSDGNA
jgi:hypothetical protein